MRESVWDDEKDAFLRKHWGTKTGVWIAKELGFQNRASISQRGAILGLRPKPKRRQKWFMAPEREMSAPPPHPAIKDDGWIKLPTTAQLMAGSANPRPRQHKVEA